MLWPLLLPVKPEEKKEIEVEKHRVVLRKWRKFKARKKLKERKRESGKGRRNVTFHNLYIP